MELLAYLGTNLYLGAGLAADVYAATVATCRNLQGERLDRWVRLNTLTHTVFPLLGMLLVVVGIAAWAPLEGALFLGGAVLLGAFLWGLVAEQAGLCARREPAPGEGDEAPERATTGLSGADPMLPLVLGVSLDAVNSGFAKAADTRDWSLVPLLLSFPLVGLVVGLTARLGARHGKALLAAALRGSADEARARFVRLELRAFALELGVLGYFFWRSLGSSVAAFGGPSAAGSRLAAVALAALTLGAVLATLGPRLSRRQERAAVELFERQPER
jgi:hypothetical protein